MSNEVELFVGTVATNIRRLRQQAGLTLAELAAEAGLGKSTLAQLESGRGNPSVETLWAIAAALRVPFGRLVEEEGPALRVVRASEQPVVRSTRGRPGRPAADGVAPARDVRALRDGHRPGAAQRRSRTTRA